MYGSMKIPLLLKLKTVRLRTDFCCYETFTNENDITVIMGAVEKRQMSLPLLDFQIQLTKMSLSLIIL